MVNMKPDTDLGEEELIKWYEQNSLSLSHQHATSPDVQMMKSWPASHELKMAWEAGRACGFHAGLKTGLRSGIKLLRDKLTKGVRDAK